PGFAESGRLGWKSIIEHDDALVSPLRCGLAAIPGVRLLGPKPPARGSGGVPRGDVTLPLATFNIDGLHHALVAARLSAEYGIGVRHGCFCAHPYLLRLLDLSPEQVADYRGAVLRHDRREMPGAVRASGGLSTSLGDVDRFLAAVAEIAGGRPAPVAYVQDPSTGDFW